MLGMIVAFFAGLSIKRAWPHGILCIAALTAAAATLYFYFIFPETQVMHRSMGEHVTELTFMILATSILTTFATYTVFFFIGWGIARPFRRKRASGETA